MDNHISGNREEKLAPTITRRDAISVGLAGAAFTGITAAIAASFPRLSPLDLKEILRGGPENNLGIMVSIPGELLFSHSSRINPPLTRLDSTISAPLQEVTDFFIIRGIEGHPNLEIPSISFPNQSKTDRKSSGMGEYHTFPKEGGFKAHFKGEFIKHNDSIVFKLASYYTESSVAIEAIFTTPR